MPRTNARELTLRLWPEVGRLLGICRASVYAAAQREDFPVLRIGGAMRVPKAPLAEMLGCSLADLDQRLEGGSR